MAITADSQILYSYLQYLPLKMDYLCYITCVCIYYSYMSVRILALLGLMCRVQSNRRLRHKTINLETLSRVSATIPLSHC